MKLISVKNFGNGSSTSEDNKLETVQNKEIQSLIILSIFIYIFV